MAPVPETLNRRTHRDAGRVESGELVAFGHGLSTTDPTNEGRLSIDAVRRADRVDVVARVGQRSAERTKVSQRLLDSLRHQRPRACADDSHGTARQT